jgi:CHRD domain
MEYLYYRARFGLAVAIAMLCMGTSAMAADMGRFETELGPTPINHVTKAELTGHGTARATLNGNKLDLSGSFVDLSTPATDAHLMLGSGIGVPGGPVQNLNVSAAMSGTFSGSFALNPIQLAALRTGRLYIQINSQKAPSPGGNLWGWLLPEHEKAGQDEPQLGHWFLPQGDGLKASSGKRQS